MRLIVYLHAEESSNGTYSSYCESVGFFRAVAGEGLVHADPVHDLVGPSINSDRGVSRCVSRGYMCLY